MLSAHLHCVVECYRVDSDRPGAFGDEIYIEGWFVSYAQVVTMRIVFPDGFAYDIADRERESEGVWKHHGASFGEVARRCRFRLIEPIGDRRPDVAAAELHVRTDRGELFAIELSRELRLPTAPVEPEAQTARALVMHFESLGDNCEFGLMQRRVGTERLSLLRYAGIGDVFALADAIERRFDGIERPGAIQIGTHGGEWIAHAHGPRLAFHTGRRVDSISESDILREEQRKLAFLAQKFIEDCEDAAKIFVYRVHRDERGGPNGTRGMNRLYDAMRAHGPVKVLWVNVADDEHQAGTIHHRRDGLYRGWIDHLAPPENAFDFRPASWIALLSRAVEVIDGEQPRTT